VNTPFTGHFISAPWRSSGKSIVSMGLARVAKQRALNIQTFKKGPDYIDPLWLKAASGKPCYNLDPYLQSTHELLQTYRQRAAEMVLVEGTMGVHDGLSVDGSDSNASIAKQLGLPVLLVIDCRGMHRTIAALVNGITQFDSDVQYSGIILNRIRSERHAKKIEQAVSQYCDTPLLGVIAEQHKLGITERELGLVPAPDHPACGTFVDDVAQVLETSCDIDTLFRHSTSRPEQHAEVPLQHDVKQQEEALPAADEPALTIGIAKDEAFHFYYEDDIEQLRSRGVRLVEFSPLRDSLPSDLDGLLLGGGFPERHAEQLASNETCRNQLAIAIANGLAVRAECGGLMYLCQSLETEQVVWPMVGAIKGAVTMHRKPQGRGYMQLQSKNTTDAFCKSASLMPAHEFHHSTISFETQPRCLFKVLRGHGLDGKVDGVSAGNVIASYAHFRHTEATPWIDWFLDLVRQSRQAPNTRANHV